MCTGRDKLGRWGAPLIPNGLLFDHPVVGELPQLGAPGIPGGPKGIVGVPHELGGPLEPGPMPKESIRGWPGGLANKGDAPKPMEDARGMPGATLARRASFSLTGIGSSVSSSSALLPRCLLKSSTSALLDLFS